MSEQMRIYQCIQLPSDPVVVSGAEFDAMWAELQRLRHEWNQICGFYERTGMEALMAKYWPDVVLSDREVPDGPPAPIFNDKEGKS